MITHTLFFGNKSFFLRIRELRVINQVPEDASIDTLFFSHMHHDFLKNEESVKTRFKSVVGEKCITTSDKYS